MWRMILVFLVAVAGFWFGKAPVKDVSIKKEFPLVEHKSFVVVIYAYNQPLLAERVLRSVFEQDYDHYRVVLIDDGSIDETFAKAEQFVLDNNQEKKVILIRNETKLGFDDCLAMAVDSSLNREIIVPLHAKDWFSSPVVLGRLDAAYQNPDVWMTRAQGLDYPSYEIRDGLQVSYYAIFFKQKGLEGAAKHTCKLDEPLAFVNAF